MRTDRYRQIGTVGKSHGLNGVVRVHFESDETGLNLKEGLVLYLQDRKGTLFPARIESLRSEFKRGSYSFFVKFDQFAGRSESEQYQDCPVFIAGDPREDVSHPTGIPDSIVGFSVSDTSGLKAVVRGVRNNPAHPIIEMEAGGKEFLVPWVDAYVIAVDRETRELRCQDLTLLTDL